MSQESARYIRVETRFSHGAKELQDLAGLAERTKGNPEKLGAAVQQLIIYWSKTVRGEISIQTFCEVMGIPLPTQGVPGGAAQTQFPSQPYGMYPSPQMMPSVYPSPQMMSGMYPPGYEQPQVAVPLPPEEDPEELERKRQERDRRKKNRNAAASEYT